MNEVHLDEVGVRGSAVDAPLSGHVLCTGESTGDQRDLSDDGHTVTQVDEE